MADAIITPPVRLAETLGAKLRRLARDAERGNPTSNLPWKAPPAYAQGEVIKYGNVRSYGGNWYVANNDATTVGATGPTHTVAQPAFDGTSSTGVLWDYMGPARMAADDPLAPTVTTEVYASPSLGLQIKPTVFPDLFQMLGASPVVANTDQWRPYVFDNKSGSPVYGYGGSIRFRMFGDAFAVDHIAASRGLTVIVDDRFVSLDQDGVPASSQWLKIVMPGGLREHRIEIRGDRSGYYFRGVRVATTGIIYPWSDPDPVRMVCIEDSIGAGSTYGPYVVGQTLHRQFGDLLGISDVWSLSRGGTGYIAKDDGTYYTYAERMAQAVALSPRILVIAGSLNDAGNSNTDITAAALATFRLARTLGYRGPIVVFGVISIDDSAAAANGKMAYIEQAVADAVTAFADPQCWFIPMRNDPVLPWVLGSWNNSAASAAVNSSLITNTADKKHPGQYGVGYYASRRAAAFRAQVLPYIK